MTGPTVIATTYTIWPTGCNPSHRDAHLFMITVERRSDLYAVCHAGECLRHDGRRWAYESMPSSRTERFSYRMPLDQALALATKHVDRLKINGCTWAEWQTWSAS